jgi:asparagine synthase (glutamine-hydrolysing)
MANEDGSVLVVFNGEIYNHSELRRELQARGHAFRSTSDTEVLVHLYEEARERMLERLEGMFAFAVYDAGSRRLLLGRDRFGIKPLYYAQLDGELIFGSELKAILALGRVPRELDRQACFDYISLGYVPEPKTGFKNVFAVSVGTFLIADDEGVRCAEYHRTEPDLSEPGSFRALASCVEERILTAVQRQSVADVPVAALLSGGIDSTLVTAAYSRVSDRPPTTFNVALDQAGYDEAAAAARVAEHVGSDHHTIRLGASGIIDAETLIRLLKHFDQPFADTSLIPTYAVARAVRDAGIICALSGDGGDEAFGGYRQFWIANQLAALMRLPGWAVAILHSTGRVSTPMTVRFGRQLARAARLARDGRSDPAQVIAGLACHVSDDQKDELIAPQARSSLEGVRRLFTCDGAMGWDIESISKGITTSLFKIALPSNMLRKVDMMSMLAGIEVRVPLLDEHVVKMGLTLPHRFKTDGSRGKLVLRDIAARWAPADIAARPKFGFDIPLARVMDAPARGAVADLVLGKEARTSGVFDAGTVEGWFALFEKAATGKTGGSISPDSLYRRILTVLSLELWMREYRLSW